MSEWKKVKLGEISLNIQTGPFGSQLHQSDYVDTGVPVIMPKDIINGKICDDTIARISSDLSCKLLKYQVEFEDIIYPRRGDISKCAIVDKSQIGWLCGTGCLKISIDKSLAKSKFIYYELQLPKQIGWIINHAIGATMLNLNTNILQNVPIDLPSINTQNRIAEILSRYDSLIENYQKQINLLEESAQRLYKEWFVDLRFPGHENTKIVDGVPEGWEKICLGELVCFKRGKTITKKEIIEGNIPVVAGGTEPAYYCNKSNTGNRVITISASGANAGYIRMYFEKIWASDCSFIDCSMTNYFHFIYCYLIANKIAIDNLQKGAAQPHVYPKDINALALCCPHNDILDSFESKISYSFDLISSLQKQIHRLTEARDRLLPKLMSGKFLI